MWLQHLEPHLPHSLELLVEPIDDCPGILVDNNVFIGDQIPEAGSYTYKQLSRSP